PVTSTGPVLPVVALNMSATKTILKLFPTVRAAIVVPATWNEMLLVIPLAPFPQVVHAIPKVKLPVPSPLKAPVWAAKVCPANGWATVMLAKLGAPLNLNAWKSAAPVFAQELGAMLTRTSTFAPFWVKVTVPNGGVPHPPVQWSDVRLNETA